MDGNSRRAAYPAPGRERAAPPEVVVIGGANIDHKSQTFGAPVPGTSNPGRSRSTVGGVGRNIAENLARLGVRTSLVTALGEDRAGERIREQTESAGVDMSVRVASALPTGRYTAVLDQHGEMLIAVAAMDLMAAITVRVIEAREQLIAAARVLVLDGNVPADALMHAAAIAERHSIPVIVDPVSVAKAEQLAALIRRGLRLHTLSPNTAELHVLASALDCDGADLDVATARLHAAGVEHVWVRRAAHGSFFSSMHRAGNRGEHLPPCAATLLDATGAGDAMLAAYVAAILRGAEPRDAAAADGRAAAAITVESAETVSDQLDRETLQARIDRCNCDAPAADAELSGMISNRPVPHLEYSAEVSDALARGRPVVALESTIISHGMPYPQNVETARDVENIVREAGAIPATIAIIDGILRVGLEHAELQLIGTRTDVRKVSTRDLAVAIANRQNGATTVAATMRIAALAGVSVFATGGTGGVHRDAAASFDVSADLAELAQTRVAVVSAGVKSILDIALTLERLETLGVPVIGFGTDEFPAFYSRISGHRAPLRLDSVADVARTMRAQWDLGLAAGLLVANPIPADAEIPAAEIDPIILRALAEMQATGVGGREATPFLLRRVVELTNGRSLTANIALVKNNARLAAQIAAAFSGITRTARD